MDINEAVKKRHSVRSYLKKEIPQDIVSLLQEEIDKCNEESGLNFQLAVNEPQAFTGLMAHYGSFRNVENYIAVVGKKTADFDEKAGYYGERIVLKAQMLGLNTCWVALTYKKGKCRCVINKGEKLLCVIALGYGETQGVEHKSKEPKAVSSVKCQIPSWFKRGVNSALLAPTAINQQRFKFILNENGKGVKAVSTGGFYSKVDLGIVKYHFETAAGKENFNWE